MTLKATLFYGVQKSRAFFHCYAAEMKMVEFSKSVKNRGFVSCSNIFFPLEFFPWTMKDQKSMFSVKNIPFVSFSGVVYPMQSITQPRRNLWKYLIPVLLLAIGFNIPKALEFNISLVEVREIFFSVKHVRLCQAL